MHLEWFYSVNTFHATKIYKFKKRNVTEKSTFKHIEFIATKSTKLLEKQTYF